MIYYKLNDVNSSILEKYFINYDIDILKKLQEEVVWKCGEKIFHKVQMGENYRRILKHGRTSQIKRLNQKK